MNRLQTKRVKAPTYIQFEAAECGAASLGTILSYFGLKLDLSELRIRCGVTRDGSNMKQLLDAGRGYGLSGRGYRTNMKLLQETGKFPCIAFWGFNHFLVIEGFSKHHVYLSDPGQGRVRVTFEEFNEKFSGIVLEFEPGKSFIRKNLRKSPLHLIPSLLKPYRTNLFLLLCVATGQSLLTLIVAGLTSVFIDSFLQNQRLYFGIPIIWILLIAVVGILLLISSQLLVFRRMKILMSKKLTADLFADLFQADYRFFQTRLQGEVARRMLLGMEATQTVVSEILRFGLSLWTGLIVLVFAMIISFWLAALVLAVFAGNLFLNWWLSEQRYDSNRKLALDQGKVQGKSLEGISNIETLKSSGLEFDFLSQWQGVFGNVISLKQNLGSQMALSSVIGSGSSLLLNGLILILGGFLIIGGQLSLGVLLAFQFLQGELVAPIAMLPQINSRLQYLMGDLGRLEDIKDSQKDPLVRSFKLPEDSPPQVSGEINEKLTGLIEFKNLEFSFSEARPPFIKDLNLTIQTGTHLSIVGGSGSGKTTLIRILAGLYQVKPGMLLFDGENWNNHSEKVMRSSIAYVPQDVFIFNATVKDNITLWNYSYDYDDLLSAAEKSQISHKILSHPSGFDRRLKDNGSDLSGGERQRIEICRALIRQPTILLLDEATSALDNATQSRVLEALQKSNTTMISVAHRLDVALQSDHVLVMNSGNIVESGSPQTLMNTDGYFKALVEKEI